MGQEGKDDNLSLLAAFTRAAVTKYHKLDGSEQYRFIRSNSRGQKSGFSSSGPRSRGRRGRAPPAGLSRLPSFVIGRTAPSSTFKQQLLPYHFVFSPCQASLCSLFKGHSLVHWGPPDNPGSAPQLKSLDLSCPQNPLFATWGSAPRFWRVGCGYFGRDAVIQAAMFGTLCLGTPRSQDGWTAVTVARP